MRRMRAGAALAVSAFDRTGTNRLAAGTLETVDNQIDTTTGMVKLRASFDNADEALFANQFVTVQLLLDTMRDKPVIPAAAVQRGAPGTFVYLVKPDDTVAVQPVSLGPGNGERVAVLDGYSRGRSSLSMAPTGCATAPRSESRKPAAMPERNAAGGAAPRPNIPGRTPARCRRRQSSE